MKNLDMYLIEEILYYLKIVMTMRLKKDFPILEFDTAPRAKIEPSEIIKKRDVPEYCVITFFGDVIKRMLDEGRLKRIADFYTTTVVLPIYETEFNGKLIGIVQGYGHMTNRDVHPIVRSDCYEDSNL